MTTSLVILLLVIFTMATVLDSKIVSRADDEITDDLNNALKVSENVLTETLTRHRKTLLFLYETPPVIGLVRAAENHGHDPVDNTSTAQWKSRLATIFTAYIKNNTDVDQLRVISFEGQGKELVRVNRDAGQISSVAEPDMQIKANEFYYSATRGLALGQFYISQIQLNREHGKLELPYRPTIRISTPIFYSDGQPFGFLIINVDASSLINELLENTPAPYFPILTTQDGYFIQHPNKKYLFSQDLASGYRWQTSYKQQPSDAFSRLTKVISLEQGSGFYFAQANIPLSGGAKQTHMNLIIGAPESVIAALMLEKRLFAYSFAIIILLILFVVIFGYQRHINRVAELSATRARFAAIVDSSKDAIVSMTHSGVVTSWNDAAMIIFGLAESQALGQQFDELALLQGTKMAPNIKRLLSSGEIEAIETSCLNKLQDVVHLSINLSKIVSKDASHNGVVALIRDVSLQKEAEEKIQQSNHMLEIKVQERTAELEIASQKALKVSSIKSDFISTVSHEMRTPLNGIIGSLNLLKRLSRTTEQQKLMDLMDSSTNILARLINDILDLSKIEAGKLEFDNQPFNPMGVLENCALTMAVKAQDKKLEFILDASGVVHTQVVGDEDRLKQILNNLLSNAIKFTQQGHVAVVAFSAERDNKVILDIAVSDTGRGIAEENKDKLFEAFSQEDSTISTDFGGTGLGLSICKRLTNMMDGDISFTSTKGKGSCFRFQVAFPLEQCKSFKPLAILTNQQLALWVDNTVLQYAVANMFVHLGASLFDVTSDTPPEHGPNRPDLIKLLVIDQANKEFSQQLRLAQTWLDTQLLDTLVILQSPFMEWDVSRNEKILVLTKPLTINELIYRFDPSASVYSVNDVDQVNGNLVANSTLYNPQLYVLLVDDNDINLEVASGYLSLISPNILRAKNGRIALDILNKTRVNGQHIHSVFMDCNMPEMDGYQCAQAIRRGEAGAAYKTVPIIAMTANAMSGEREKCLTAGMDDYMTKPIVPKVLENKIKQWTLPEFDRLTKHKKSQPLTGDRKMEETTAAPDDKKVATTQLPLAVWDQSACLVRMMNNQALLDRITQMFLVAAPEKFALLESAMTAQDFAQVHSISHSLKGLSAEVGALRFNAVMIELEASAKNQDSQAVSALKTEVTEQFNAMLKQMSAHYS
ncbi:ATP-binding protein [Paraglaciecola hydrolytica]|nr:ATP-binding protein [Paraglaciecola hydrolytica]